MKINIPHMLLNLRQQLVERRKTTWTEKLLFTVWARLMQHPRLYAWSTALAALAQKPLASQGWLRKLPPPFHGWTQSRDFKAAAPHSFRQRWRHTLQHEDNGITGLLGEQGHE